MDNHRNEFEETDKDYNGRLMNNITRLPMIIGDSKGSVLHDIEHDVAIKDYWGESGVCSLGYNSIEFRQAILEFMTKDYPHRLPDVYPHDLRWEVAAILCDRTGMDKVFFSNSGTEAVEAAIKLVRKYWWDREGADPKKPVPDRHVILTVEGNFHGRTGLSMAASDCRTSPYHRWGFGPIAKGFGVLEPDDEYRFWQVVSDGEEHPRRFVNWSEVAAIILAPVLGNNTIKTYAAEFWKELEAIRKVHGVLLIYDDIQTGSGRTGNYATWMDESIRVKPDVMTLAKGTAMGFPIGVTLASHEVASAFTPGVHFTTFGGGLLILHMVKTLYKWLDLNLIGIREKGELIRSAFFDMDWISSYDGLGMFNAFRPDYERFGYNGFAFVHEARKLGLSLMTHRAMNSIHFTPPLNAPEKEIRLSLDALNRAHRELMRGR